MYNEVQKRANLKYAKNNYKRIPLDVRKEFYEEVKKYCDEKNVSINGLIKELLEKEIKKS